MKNIFLVFNLLICFVVAAYASEGVSMSLLKGSEVCVFSAMKGIITLQGKPVAGAKIVRKVAWKDEAGESEETTTNANGEFEFAVMNRSLRQVLPAQFVATQEINVHYDGKDYLIWTMGKMDKSEYGELGGKPENFRCELSDDLVRVEVPVGLLGTRCIWERES
jgi:hypothetical protein